MGSVAAARAAVAAGVDVVVAQGTESGGHVAGEVSTLALVPRVVDAAMPVPVVASGGIADGRGLVAALALGAAAAVFGTRFLATNEANTHPLYKSRVLAAGEEDTVRTILFGRGWPHAPHRTLRTAFVEEWLGHEERGQEDRTDEPVIGHTQIAGQEMPILRFVGIPPNRDATGEIEAMDLLAGQGVGLVGRNPARGRPRPQNCGRSSPRHRAPPGSTSALRIISFRQGPAVLDPRELFSTAAVDNDPVERRNDREGQPTAAAPEIE